MHHPWRHLRSLGHIELHWVELPPGQLAVTDGEGTIWMHRRQRQAQRRSSLAHELEHIEQGHRGCQPPAIERRVEEAAARRLIDLDDLAHAMAWARSSSELTEELHVDHAMLVARLRSLTPDETRRLQQVVNAREDT